MPPPEVPIARVKLCVSWLVRGCGLRDEPAGCATNDLVSSLAASGLSTCSVQVAPLLLYDRDLSGDGPYAAWTPCASGSGPRGARPPVHAGLPTCADGVLTGG